MRGKRQVAIAAAVCTVGRGDDVHLQFDDPSVSRRHAELRACGDQLIVEDLGSRNGTFVNGQRIEQPVTLRPGDDLVFGACGLRVGLFSKELSEGYATQPIERRVEASALGNLSPRERQLLPLLARGLSQRELAAQLGVTVKTIETYRTRIGHKLGLTSRAGLVRFALDNGLLQPTGANPSLNEL